MHSMIEKLSRKACNSPSRFCKHHQAARVFIDAVYKPIPWEFGSGKVTVLLEQVPGYAVNECPPVIATGGMHNKSDGFVDNHHFVVFVGDVEWNGFGNYL